MQNHNTVIAFDPNRRAKRTPAGAPKGAAEGLRDNVIAIAEWKSRARPRRTAAGVYFTTGVLTTYGSAA